MFIKEIKSWILTCVPHILYPHIGTCSEKYILQWYKEETYHVGCERYANEEHWECLKQTKYV